MDASTTSGAIRARRYRDRKKDGTRCVRVRMSEPAIRALVEGGFLPAAARQDADIERAIYELIKTAHATGVTCNGAGA